MRENNGSKLRNKTRVQRYFIKEQIRRVKQIPKNKALKEHTHIDTKETNRVPFMIADNPSLPNIHKILHRKQPILYSLVKSSKKHLSSLTVAFLTFVTSWFVLN